MRVVYDVELGWRRGDVRLTLPPPAPPPPQPLPHKGLTCARCKRQPAGAGCKSCPSCREYDRIKAAIRRDEMRSKGACLVCGRPAKQGEHVHHGKAIPWRHCEEHLAYYRFHTRRG